MCCSSLGPQRHSDVYSLLPEPREAKKEGGEESARGPLAESKGSEGTRGPYIDVSFRSARTPRSYWNWPQDAYWLVVDEEQSTCFPTVPKQRLCRALPAPRQVSTAREGDVAGRDGCVRSRSVIPNSRHCAHRTPARGNRAGQAGFCECYAGFQEEINGAPASSGELTMTKNGLMWRILPETRKTFFKGSQRAKSLWKMMPLRLEEEGTKPHPITSRALSLQHRPMESPSLEIFETCLDATCATRCR